MRGQAMLKAPLETFVRRYTLVGPFLWDRVRLSLVLPRAQEMGVTMDLDQNGFVPLRRAGGFQLACMSGMVWVTTDYDARDIVLEAGGVHCLPRKRVSFVSALTPARIALSWRKESTRIC